MVPAPIGRDSGNNIRFHDISSEPVCFCSILLRFSSIASDWVDIHQLIFKKLMKLEIGFWCFVVSSIKKSCLAIYEIDP